MTASDLQLILGHPNPDTTEDLLRISSLKRFEDLRLLTAVIVHNEYTNSYAESIVELLNEIACHPAEVDDRLRSPIFRGWLRRFSLVLSDWNPNDALLMEQLRFLNNMRYSFCDARDWAAILAVENGVCMTWDCRLALHGIELKQVYVKKNKGELSLSIPNGPVLFKTVVPGCGMEDVNVRRAIYAPTLPYTEIAVRNDLPLLQLKINEPQFLNREHAVDYREFDHRIESYGNESPTEFQEAAALVADAWSEEYDDWRKTLRVVVPRNPPPGCVMNGMTAASHQGACWIAARGVLPILEALVHEQSHIKLRYLEEAHPILSDVQTNQTFTVGWRHDPRPIIGIYEGIYVNLHAIEALLRVAEKGTLPKDQTAQCRKRANDLRHQVQSAVSIVRKNAHFTDIGQGFLSWALSRIEDFSQYSSYEKFVVQSPSERSAC